MRRGVPDQPLLEVQSVHVLETERLYLRQLDVEDAEFILTLLNDPSFLRFIGDKGVRTLEDAREYIRNGPQASYERFHFGMYLTALKSDSTPIGICGLVQRTTLADVDVGFAFLPEHWSKGYAFESASAVLVHAKEVHALSRLVAIASPENRRSITLLERLGFALEGLISLTEGSPEVSLLSRSL